MVAAKVFTVQILQRRAILFFPTPRRDRQMARQTQDTRGAGKVHAIPLVAAFPFALKKKKKEKKEKKRRGGNDSNASGPRKRLSADLASARTSVVKWPVEVVFCYFHISNFNPEIHDRILACTRRGARRGNGRWKREVEASNPYMQI